MNYPRLFRLACALTVLPLVGCGSGNPHNRQPVSGVVTLDGAPLSSGTVEFVPQEAPVGGGAVISNGAYDIPTTKGLPPGKYLVRVFSAKDALPRSPDEAPGGGKPPGIQIIPPKYNLQSDLIVEVQEGVLNQFDVAVQTK